LSFSHRIAESFDPFATSFNLPTGESMTLYAYDTYRSLRWKKSNASRFLISMADEQCKHCFNRGFQMDALTKGGVLFRPALALHARAGPEP
jgi:hypothetical protein